MRCVECGKYPFCEFIENPQEKACEKSIKKPVGGIENEQRENERD